MTIGRKSYIRPSGQATWQTQELPPFVMPAGSAGAPVADVESVLDHVSPYAMTMTMRFSDFDKPVHIQPPRDSSP